jgi:parallel beta-helix repeat protein
LIAWCWPGSNFSSATSGTTSAGATTTTVADGSGFVTGQRIGYTLTGGALEQNILTGKVGGILSLQNPVGTGGITSGTFVYGVSPEMYAAANVLPHSGSLTMPTAMGILGARYSPLAYGADGSGVADATTAINAMLTAAPGGSVIDLGAGKTYKISGQLAWSAKPLYILGLGATIVEAADLGNLPTVKVSGAGAAGSILKDFVIQGVMTSGTFPGADTDRVGIWVETDNVTVENIKISGKQFGVKLETANNCVVDIIRFTGVFSGSVLTPITGSNYHSGVRTRLGARHYIGRVFADSCGSGVLLGGPSTDTTIAHCVITNTWDNGIYVSGCDGTTIINNRVTTSGGSGIKNRGSYAQVERNTIVGTVSGISISGYNTDVALRDSYGADGADIVISSNILRNITQDGINLASSPATPAMYVRHLKITNNVFDTVVTGGGAYGAIRGGAYYAEIARNSFLNCGATSVGVSLAGANHDPRTDGALGWLTCLIVEDNLFDGLGAGIAMQIQWMQHGRVNRNTFRNLPSHCIKLLNCSYSMLRDNTATDAVGGNVLWASLANGNSNNTFASNIGTVTIDTTTNTVYHNSGDQTHQIGTGQYQGATALLGTNTSSGSSLTLNGANNTSRQIIVQTAGVARWILQTQTSETGSGNVGSDLALLSRTDAGAGITTALLLNRATAAATFGGSLAVPLSTKTAAYTILDSDSSILADATSAAFTVTLPTAVGRTGRIFRIKRTNSGANAVTVGTTSAQVIDGAATYSLSAQYAYVTVQSNGTNWWIIAKG